MSQASEEKPKQLLIDLTNARHATALDASSILHRMQIEVFLERVKEVVGRVEEFSAKLKRSGDGHIRSISYERYHDAITLHGKRGSGKTTFLLSALELLHNPAKRRAAFPELFKNNNDDDGLNGLCVLEILDPTLFGLHEHLLLSLLAKIAFEVRSAVKNSERYLCSDGKGHCNIEEWENQLRQFAKALKHMGETRDDLDGEAPKETVQWDDAEFIFEQNLDSARRSFGLEREFHSFLNNSLYLIGKKAFVLALDDIDTRPQIGWHVLEVLRRYFTSPQLVVVLSGDMDLFKTIIEKQQLKIFDLNFSSTLKIRNEFKSKVDGLTEQFLLKILRTPSRINLGSFQSALQQWGRINPEVAQKIGKSEEFMPLDVLLKRTFFPLLACSRRAEQRLFRQTLFANSARTVTQVLDILWGISSSHPGHQLAIEGSSNIVSDCLNSAACDLAVERMREVFLVSLQNIGFGRPFDLAEALQSASGVNLLMQHLFVRGYVTTGLDLLPTRQNSDENNALLALNAELTQAMRANPALLLGYALKVCLLREVLLRKNSEIDATEYRKYERYLGLEADELSSVTAARISALHWGKPKPNNSILSMGMVRLYGSSITKNAPAAVRSMYGVEIIDLQDEDAEFIPEELLRFCKESEKIDLIKNKTLRRWINTPETLYDSIFSWQSGLMGVGIVDISDRDNVYRMFSIFPLIAVMCDLLEKDERSIEVLLSRYNQIINMNSFYCEDGALLYDADADDDKEDIQNDELNGSAFVSREFVESLDLWAAMCKKMFLRISAPAVLCANVMSRFFYALQRIDANFTNKAAYVGVYVHRCLVAFFNSVLVEEFLLMADNDGSVSVLLDNPATVDDIFLKNMFSSRSIDMIDESEQQEHQEHFFSSEFKQYFVEKGYVCDKYPLFKSVFTCPLWGLYLKPEKAADDKIVSSVYEIYIHSQFQPKETVETTISVTYGEMLSTPNFVNMFELLNSLAIPKSGRSDIRSGSETRTDEGKKLGLPLSPKTLKRKSIISHDDVKKVLLDLFQQHQEDQPQGFFDLYSSLVRHLYRDEAVIKKLTDPNLAEGFWAFAKKNLKP